MDVLKIGGSLVLKVQKLTVTREAIWSKNTGRTADAKMRGDIVGHKFKLQATFTPLTDGQAAELSAATRPSFFDVEFKNPETQEMETRTMYAGSLPFPVYSYAEGLPRYVGTAIEFIEQ